MKILVSGSNGLVGSSLMPALSDKGHQVVRLVRGLSPAVGSEIAWDPEGGRLDPALLTGFDAIVHLAGEAIAARRWTQAQKDRIRESRVKGTRLLCEAIAGLSAPPRTLLSASAIGYYGDRGEQVLGEESPPGQGYLSEVCQAWEAATEPAAHKGIRVVCLRFGIILSPAGGALAKMLPPFSMGAGGILGSGRQYMSWISLDDAVGAVLQALETSPLRGPVNVVAPHAVTNALFTKTLGRVLSRPTFFPMPAFAARMVFGEMADALLLSSARVEPKRLLASNYPFRHRELEPALRHLLRRS
ncbi:MAG: TIGR01777 family oxidoreductase [Acidobacteria bacterium]|nr:TIGR01777 family oxidoreductase [Acidobacteriota bacterium]